MTDYARNSSAAQGRVSCHSCHRLYPAATQRCSRCGASLSLRKSHSLQTTLALIITAILLYIPANLLPIMTTTTLGSSSSKTIIGGVAVFMEHGDLAVAAIIFFASVVIPIAKLLALGWLCLTVAGYSGYQPMASTRLFRLTELVGRWSMIDVFVVAVMAALVQLGNVMTIEAGPATLAFAGVVIATMLAANSFDPRLVWDAAARLQEGSNAQ